MRRVVKLGVAAATVGVSLMAGTALASANDRDDGEDRQSSTGRAVAGPPFELEIDPDLDAQFGARPVNAVRAAEIATARFGGRVVEAELEEEDGRPYWELELVGAAADTVDVDAIDGRVLDVS